MHKGLLVFVSLAKNVGILYPTGTRSTTSSDQLNTASQQQEEKKIMNKPVTQHFLLAVLDLSLNQQLASQLLPLMCTICEFQMRLLQTANFNCKSSAIITAKTLSTATAFVVPSYYYAVFKQLIVIFSCYGAVKTLLHQQDGPLALTAYF